MCGIFGIISGTTKSGRSHVLVDGGKMLFDGSVLTSLRGMDSTGIFQVREDGKTFSNKEPLCASVAFDSALSSYTTTMHSAHFTTVHCRAATVGNVSRKNAHPFEIKYKCASGHHYLLGVHNGTLEHGWKSSAGAKDHDVDSSYAIELIANNKEKAFTDNMIKGAYSFVWRDTLKPTVAYFARNSERPMWMVRSKDGRHIMFASEPDTLAYVLRRHGNLNAFEDTFYSTEPNKLYAVDFSNDTLSLEVLAEWTPPVRTYTPRWSGWGMVDGGEWAGYQPSLLREMDALVKKAADAAPKTVIVEHELGSTIPCEAYEIGDVNNEDMYLDHVPEAHMREAEKRGLMGQIVVFTRDNSNAILKVGHGDAVALSGNIKCVMDTDMWDMEKAKDVYSTLVWPKTIRDHPKNRGRVFCAIAGIDDSSNIDKYILSPLKPTAALAYGPKMSEWTRKNAPNLMISS